MLPCMDAINDHAMAQVDGFPSVSFGDEKHGENAYQYNVRLLYIQI